MGLSSNQVSGDDGVDQWSQILVESQFLEPSKAPTMTTMTRRQPGQARQYPPEKCPRCDSTNTKFCYYNNYNKSQPRYLCKACKRHWTKGGTLRNVPVGGARKNNRKNNSNNSNNNKRLDLANVVRQADQELSKNPSFIDWKEKNVPEILYQSLMCTPSSSQAQQNLTSCSTFGNRNGIFLDSTLNQQYPLICFQSSGSFGSKFSSFSSSIQSASKANNVFDGESSKIMEDHLAATTSMAVANSSMINQNSSCMDMMKSFWSWDYVDDKFALCDLSGTCDDAEIKP